MYTDFMANALLHIIKFTNFIGFLPYRLDPKQGKLYIHFWSYARCVHNTSWIVTYALICLPTHLYHAHKTSRIAQFNYSMLIWFANILMALLLTTVCCKPLELCQLVNSLWKFLTDFGDNYLTRSNSERDTRRNKFVEFILVATYLSLVIIGVLTGLDSVIRPHIPVYPLYGTDPRFVTWPFIILSGGWYGGSAVGCLATAGFLFYHAVIIFYFILEIVKHELRKGRPYYRTSYVLRLKPKHLVLTWRSIQVYIQSVNVEFCFLLSHLDSAITVLAVTAVVTLTFHWSTLGFFSRACIFCAGLFPVMLWCLLLTVAGELYRSSIMTAHTWVMGLWACRKDRQYMRRMKLACGPIAFGNGNSYEIRPTSTLKFLGDVGCYCLTALITYQHLHLE